MPTRTINNLGDDARKRRRQDDDSDSEEESEVDVRGQQRKRARIAAGKRPARAADSQDETPESSNGEDDDQDADADMQNTLRYKDAAATQYELMRDAGFKHLEYADEDDRRATQRLQAKDIERQSSRKGITNRASENGILLSIHCVNFMCHSSLNIELGPLLNFIVGENGSGKSAVLTAITLCLGGKASSTNRGGSLKAFIKEGQHEARLIVKIKNEGDDAYQRELYGDFIQVERRFNRSGTSSFRILSAGGKIITKKKQDVDDIVEYYCLQVDNPLNVLSQDNARQFLNQATAKQKYKFFLQGVQLQQLDDDYRVIEEYLNSNENKEGDLETRVKICKQDYDRAKKDYSLYMESEDMRAQHLLQRQKLAWCQVEQQERAAAENAQKTVEWDGRVAEARRLISEKGQELAKLDQQIEQAEEEVRGINESHSALSTRVEEATRKYTEARAGLSKLHTDEGTARSQLDSIAKSVEDYERRVKAEEERLQAANGEIMTRKRQEKQDAQEKKQLLNTAIIDRENQIPALNANIDKGLKELGTIEQQITQKKAEVAAILTRIRELEQGQGSLYDGYERQMPQLLRMIAADNGFVEQPVGPMGAHIKVLKPFWTPMLERMIGEQLNGFVVTNKSDQQRLKDMMNRLRIYRSPIIIGNSTPIDTSRSEPDENFDTVLRILNVDNPLILNQLIINQRIEKTILIQDQNEANDIMINSAPPRNVLSCYHAFARRHNWFVRITATASGASSVPQGPAEGKPRLQSDSMQETSVQKASLGQIRELLKELQLQKAAQQQTVDSGRKQVQEITKTNNQDRQRMRDIQVEIDDIAAELDAFEGADGRLSGLLEDLDKARETFDLCGSQYGQAQLSKSKQSEVCQKLRDELRSEKRKQEEFEPQLKKAQSKSKRLGDLRHIALQEKNEAHEQEALAAAQKKRYERKQEGLQSTVAEWIRQSEQICPRIHLAENETYDTIAKRLESLERTLKERERRRGMTDEQVRRRLIESKEALEELQTAFNQVQLENRALKKSMVYRLKKWRLFQRYISSNSRANFMYLLSERDFRGKLLLDHENHTLEVQVEPDKTRKNAAARNTKTLSGGEKSFSSICLLLAIWEAMGSPLRCLDEFDVFMDNVNRAISTNMLISAARNSVGRQYILITPNAIEGRANLDKDVQIIRMRDPRQKGLDDFVTAS
ncbi:RecF/RecN/SMC N terminal domain-containing protein [Coniella lustricola]|uniref:RecF/RecN/SMC N terminal domain-containing protein n=1 Tax=Coniella lustricola TaxID=2025994 RepID=A0A2T3A828_9PEZI|nr:RecF/RecN/SMC N terminal domain-containing protein [Coniella lustricola]